MVTYGGGPAVKDFIDNVKRTKLENPTESIRAYAYIAGRFLGVSYLVCEITAFSQDSQIYCNEFDVDEETILQTRVTMSSGQYDDKGYVEIAFLDNSADWVKEYLDKKEGEKPTWMDELTASRIVKKIKDALSKACSKDKYKFK